MFTCASEQELQNYRLTKKLDDGSRAHLLRRI